MKLTKEEKAMAIKSAKVLGLTIAGVDMLRSVNGSLVIEVNSSPGLEGIETVTGIDIAGKIIDYIEQNYKKSDEAIKDKIKVWCSKFNDKCSKFDVQSSKFDVQW